MLLLFKDPAYAEYVLKFNFLKALISKIKIDFKKSLYYVTHTILLEEINILTILFRSKENSITTLITS